MNTFTVVYECSDKRDVIRCFIELYLRSARDIAVMQNASNNENSRSGKRSDLKAGY